MKWRNLKPRTAQDQADISRPVDTHTEQLKQLCEGRDTRWYTPYRMKLNVCLFFLLITSMSNGFDGSMMNGLQTLSYWRDYFGNPTSGELGLFNAIQNLGNLGGLPFAPYINDKLGRKWTLFGGCCFMIMATALQTAAQNKSTFLVARFFIGFGNAWASISAPIWITELAFPTHRAQLTSMYNSLWYAGSIVAAWTTFGTFRIESTWSWRIPSVVQGVPPLFQICFLMFIPESPRWLIDHGKDERALDIISKWHCNGDRADPLVAFEYEEISTALRLEKAAKNSSSWLGLFTNKANLRRFRIIIFIAFASQWSGNGIVSYYLNIVLRGIGITGEFEQNLLNGCLQIYNLITALTGALVVEKAGRRLLFLTSTGGMCLSYMVWTILSAKYDQSATEYSPEGDPLNGNRGIGNAVLFAIFVFYGFYNIALSPLIVSYTVEILPFRIRSRGLMVFQVAVSLSIVFNQYVNPIALESLGWRYYIVYTVWLAIEFIYLYFTLVETKGRNGSPLPLEEIARLFDGDDAQPDLLQEEADRRRSDATMLNLGEKAATKEKEGGVVEHVEGDLGHADAEAQTVRHP